MKKCNVRIIPVIYIMVTFFAACILLWVNSNIAIQSQKAIYPKVYFQGEYKIGEGTWQEYRQGMHLSANKADITLRGTFHKYFPELGESINEALNRL